MRLHDFILANREQILAEWETFARTCAPASATMDVAALRDHANAMLTVIAADLGNPQSGNEQSEKSKGRARDTGSTVATAAEEHGSGRAESGFTVEQMVAEYRALRASVIRLWTREQGELKSGDIEDLTRFNEAIDQALAESVSEFNENVENAKEMFLAILGHDLRTPLGAIYTSAAFMLDIGELAEPHRSLTARIARSATRTIDMVGDLLDFTRSRLGGGIPVVRAEMDLAKVEPVGRCGGLLRAHRVDQSRQAGTCFLPRGSRPRVAQPREQVGAQRVRADIGECVADVVDLAAASGK
jgi:signal transduction histidine kinase